MMLHRFVSLSTLLPGILMLAAVLLQPFRLVPMSKLWQVFVALSGIALACAVATAIATVTAFLAPELSPVQGWLSPTPLGIALAVLVQLLGTIIGAYSSRYLQGEKGQDRYITALAGVLSAVHLLLLANHWLVLISAWALVGAALQHLLCFYPDRPFALLAAHKKRIADRAADALLIGAGTIAWVEVGSGSFTDLWSYLDRETLSLNLQISATCFVLGVILRTALLPVHGWLIQVMEAPTPVSALLHAGVVNLGGFLLIRFAPFLEHAMVARVLLLAFGLGSAVLAGLVMLTRISIKVRLAWSTVAQMGFMVLECSLGLYTLAALHLVGHSLYKAQVFLSASMVVQHSRLQAMRGPLPPAPISLLLAPVVAVSIVFWVQTLFANLAWPWWWSVVVGMAWSPLLWLQPQGNAHGKIHLQGLSGILMLCGLTGATLILHGLPLGILDAPNRTLGMIASLGMALLYLTLVVLQLHPQALRTWRRWSYAGFYVDEAYTRLALHVWPTHWVTDAFKTKRAQTTS